MEEVKVFSVAGKWRGNHGFRSSRGGRMEIPRHDLFE